MNHLVINWNYFRSLDNIGLTNFRITHKKLKSHNIFGRYNSGISGKFGSSNLCGSIDNP
jgi:hypothetical protein